MARFERTVLVLDAHFVPARILPLHAGFVLYFSGRASSLADSPHTIRSVTQSFKVPWIVRVNNAPPKKARAGETLKFSRQNIYLRDNHRCTYCGTRFGAQQLTLDHLVPLSRGGKTTWENIVTSCRSCNFRKGSATIEELGIRLERLPARPHLSSQVLFALRYGLETRHLPLPWLPFLDTRSIERAQELLQPSHAPQSRCASTG